MKRNSLLFNLLILLIIVYFVDTTNSQCDLVETKYGLVCRCSTDYCDYLEEPKLEADTSWFMISSSKNGLRFHQTEGKFTAGTVTKIEDYHKNATPKSREERFNPDAIMVDNRNSLGKIFGFGPSNVFSLPIRLAKSSASITINRNKTYQKITGFGGAFTGTVAYLLDKLKPELQDHLYKSYYHKDGIGYNMIRTSIGGCDFDLEPWAYNEMPQNDATLSNFTQLDKRDILKVEQIKRLQRVTAIKDLKIMAAAWSPPPWMKTNNNWTGFSQLKSTYYQTWALYHLKFLELMQAKNITIWAISTGNEPLNGVIGWFFVHFMSLGWTPRNQAIYLNDYLGPMLRKSQFKDVLIFGNDDQRYTYPTWFERMNATNPESLKYLDGLAVHWYWDDVFGPELIDNTMKLYPDKLLLNTESCVGDKPWQTHGPELGSWERGEQYIKAFLQDLQHNFNGWIDWNLLLDEKGGPNYVNNFVDAPIVVNTSNYSEFYKQPMFYSIGHFSKFIWPDSKRIDVKVTSLQQSLSAVGFQRSDGVIVVVIFNSASIPQDITLNDGIRGTTIVNVPPRSIHTMLYK
ncbi:lysosomal acid glucosylceramidase-like [Musca autumnalis]|uniref:lysosomal acid glucosylceramidase-like n=1 Tax=Musca autumnalis TaxID=221902 RepID=UPI003CF080AE